MAVTAPTGGMEAIEAKVRSARRLAPTNIAAHAWLLHRDDRDRRLVMAAHQQVIGAVLQDPVRYPYVVVVCPPGYAKSTYGSVVYPAWRQGMSGGKVRMGLISNTATQAEGFAKAVQQVMETEEYQLTYPDVRRDPSRKWTNREMYFTNTPQGSNPGLMAMGMDGPILGKRFDEIIIDDPSTWDQVRSEVVMTEQRNKLLNTVIQRFPAGSRPPHGDGSTRMVVLMTRYGQRDLLPTFQDLNFTIVHMPALGYWDRLITCGECGARRVGGPPCDHHARSWEVEFGTAALWPEAESQQQLQAMMEHDELIFELVYQGNTAVLSGDMFDPDWFRRGKLPGRFDLVVMGVDTAGGRDKKKGDYTAIVVLGFRGDEVWLLHAWRDRVPAPEQERKVQSVFTDMSAAGWTPQMVYVEDKNEGRAVYDHLVMESRLPLKASKIEGDKEFRAVALSNAYRRGGVWHPEGEKWLRPLEAELEAFPEGAHDDFVDAMTLAFNETRGGKAHGPRLTVLG